jgi:hypothetical protein
METIDQQISEGLELVATDDIALQERGRLILEDLSALGNDEATFNLGKLYEFRSDFNRAEELYMRGFNNKYRAAVFRLARMHGEELIKNPDTQFYLQTIKALSKDWHFPSVARYTHEQLRGSYGIAGVFLGCIMFLPNIFLYFYFAGIDPRSSRFEK